MGQVSKYQKNCPQDSGTANKVSTQCATDCASNTSVRANMGVCIVFKWSKPYFNVCALILYVCEGSSQAITHAKNYGINIFEYKGHDLWHTRYVCVSGWYQT